MPAESNILSVPKSSEKLFERGFKAWCDNTSLGIRKKMGLKPSDPLSAYDLAEQLNVNVVALDSLQFLPTNSRDFLAKGGDGEWSAATIQVGGHHYVVINPSHSLARQSSNLMHELAHIIREHTSTSFSMQDGIAMRPYDSLQENEANWFAGSLLLTQNALFAINTDNLDEELAKYGVSKSLYNWRLNVTGVRRRLMRSNN